METFNVKKNQRRKTFEIVGPKLCDNNISVEYTDATHDDMFAISEKIALILNDNWDKSKYVVYKDKDTSKLQSTLKKNFKIIFDEVMSDESNGETAEDISVKINKNEIKIEFSVDGDDYGVHDDNSITIKNFKIISSHESEFLESRNGLSDVEKQLQKFLDILKEEQ